MEIDPKKEERNEDDVKEPTKVEDIKSKSWWETLATTVIQTSNSLIDQYKDDVKDLVNTVVQEAKPERVKENLRKIFQDDSTEDNNSDQGLALPSLSLPNFAIPKIEKQQIDNLLNKVTENITNFVNDLTGPDLSEEVKKFNLNESFYLNPIESIDYKNYVDSVNIEDKTTEISKILQTYPEVSNLFGRLVPEKLEYKEFWCRFFFHVEKTVLFENKEEVDQEVITDTWTGLTVLSPVKEEGVHDLEGKTKEMLNLPPTLDHELIQQEKPSPGLLGVDDLDDLLKDVNIEVSYAIHDLKESMKENETKDDDEWSISD
ncbi:hypothetical protein O9G_002193 [Rozella allomycis CSF55]|uniref:BSD domain-containing protein n=1 Tax=Rozella allomycis (strain CSF55) TaxID=988480 RepID=A0A075AQ65_ROZAC|nr:hypothetical protein O9G_002193 [Rozella allomycis CSF55]|eukprot:EPZ32353.1 hypothetical protein O9G_002193 [Rozella allomycis CSF55]